MSAPTGLDQHDPWPLRLVIIFVGVIGVASVAGITVLSVHDKDVQGFFTVPISAITALAMTHPKRPPWSRNRDVS